MQILVAMFDAFITFVRC